MFVANPAHNGPVLPEASLGVLGPWDMFWLAVYITALVTVTVYVSRKAGDTSEEFFLGGRHAHWWAIGFSLFASNIGTDHLVGLCGSGAAGGLAVGMYEFNATGILLLLGWVFVPYYMAYEVFTVPEFLEKRFDRSLRNFMTWLTIISTILTKIAVTIFAGAVVLEEVLGWNLYFSSFALLLVTALYTVVGGLAAVIYTEVVQSVFLIAGSLALLYFGVTAAGGIEGMVDRLPEAHWRLLKDSNHPDFPWLGVLVGMPICSIWYWCTDQVMVQRVLATETPRVSQEGCVFASWLKLLPMYIMVLPGLCAAALFPHEIEEDSNRAYALMVTRLLPEGWVGIMVAVMVSSFMAALASCFNSCSTLFTLDLYQHYRPDASDHELVHAGRAFTLLTAVLSLAWLPMVGGGHEQLFLYIQAMQVIWCPPIGVMFLGARYIPEMGSRDAWVVIIFGLTLGVIFWAIQNLIPDAKLHGTMLQPVNELNILHYAIVAFILCWAALGASLASSDGSRAEKAALLRSNIYERIREQDWAGATVQFWAVGVLVVVTGLIIFHTVFP